jgi:hypothetical protein
VLGIVAAGALFASPASAGEFVIVFDDLFKTTTGTLSYDPSVDSFLHGTSIPMTFIVGEPGQVPFPGAITCLACELNFTTGANTVQVNGDDYVWAGNPDPMAFTITGRIFGDLAPVVLLNGPINGATFNNDTGQFTATLGGTDLKDQRILNFFFCGGPAIVCPTPEDFIYTNTNINASGVTFAMDGGFTAAVSNADVTNTNAPEPGSALLLLLGLGSLVAYRRRKN